MPNEPATKNRVAADAVKNDIRASGRVVAAVVTHNRKALLARCIDALERQTRRVDRIVVIDNASTDGTREMLQSRGVHAVHQDNVGSAGGWHTGVVYAMENGFDSVWLMDDDGFPADDALEKLELHSRADVACLSSAVVVEDDPGRLVFPLPRLNRRGLPVLIGAPRKFATVADAGSYASGGLFPYAHLFNGALIPVSVTKKIGNVEREFFIFGDELDFLYRLKRAGGVYTVLEARQYHPDIGKRPLTDAKIYYYVKNTLILNRRYMDHRITRDVATVVAALARAGARNGWREAASYIAGKKARILRSAISRGRSQRLGKDFVA